jgi:competence protein ComEC
MSFAATVALISAYEVISARGQRDAGLVDRRERSFVDRVRQTVATLFFTSLVAGLATAPFGAFYFQRVAPLTILANMAAAPAVGFIVMPMALLAVVAMPFGLEALPLTVMKWGLQWMLEVASRTAAWSEGLGGVVAPPAAALLLMVAGFLWLTLWSQRWRLAGLVPIVLAVPLALAVRAPDILVDEDASAVAVRGTDGRLHMMTGPRGGATFEIEAWLRADADPRNAKAADLRDGVACDPAGCIAHAADGTVVALTLRPEGFADDCRMAGVVVSRLVAPAECATSAIVVDRTRLDLLGAHALYHEREQGFSIETAYPAAHRPFMPPVRS